MSDAHLDPHLQAEHEAPERTTPQGFQTLGLEHGHEGRDVIYGPIFWWFGGLSIFMGLVLIILHGTMGLWGQSDMRASEPPSALFTQQREIPEPRILPNPIDSGPKPMGNVQLYPETVPGEREREAKQAADLGLLDAKTGEPVLPDNLANQVAARYGSPAAAGARGAGTGGKENETAPAGVQDIFPSDSSGGTQTEDRLR